ncbi:MAG: hypothetical protein H7301_02415 [Cryobacterium sp.]|nr:hypothetical protein [Oligoflexia bacterium]
MNASFKLILSTVLFSSAAFAEVPTLDCTIKDPCEFSAPSKLGYCLNPTFKIREEEGQMQAVIGKQDFSEVFSIAALFPISEYIGKLMGHTKEGETWMELLKNNRTGMPLEYTGDLVLEEDFGFRATCYLAD